ncbi:MAG TPA: DinB family protein [Pyrinomonadaceae bacterium]|nr:DinB family protein [Pyrinomonadaceae bacterium]HMP64757.1 DinB family protein [Pyrinomonadaceae bacterium]
MFRRITDFSNAWKYEVEATSKILNALNDGSLGQRVTDDGRTLGFIAWHIVLTPGEMLAKAGLTIDSPPEDAECPPTSAEIASTFEKVAASVSEQVPANWTDETLREKDEMYGETWARGLTLFYLIAHQTHHRGQMTVLMRQAGLTVPGVYGPAKEEWAAMGAPALP